MPESKDNSEKQVAALNALASRAKKAADEAERNAKELKKIAAEIEALQQDKPQDKDANGTHNK